MRRMRARASQPADGADDDVDGQCQRDAPGFSECICTVNVTYNVNIHSVTVPGCPSSTPKASEQIFRTHTRTHTIGRKFIDFRWSESHSARMFAQASDLQKEPRSGAVSPLDWIVFIVLYVSFYKFNLYRDRFASNTCAIVCMRVLECCRWRIYIYLLWRTGLSESARQINGALFFSQFLQSTRNNAMMTMMQAARWGVTCTRQHNSNRTNTPSETR